MPVAEVETVLNEVINCVQEIDRECATVLNDVEHGLINVESEFQERALVETGKFLTGEPLIAWLTWKKLRERGWRAEWEVRYPRSNRKKCDIVVGLDPKEQLWLELKLASKAWFNCEGGPAYNDSLFRSYLRGTHRSHSFRQDFEKLTDNPEYWSAEDYRSVCLIGFDSVARPMDAEVTEMVREVQQAGSLWRLVSEGHWHDRRCSDFRISAWCWLLEGQIEAANC